MVSLLKMTLTKKYISGSCGTVSSKIGILTIIVDRPDENTTFRNTEI